jgi:hypothetical protein
VRRRLAVSAHANRRAGARQLHAVVRQPMRSTLSRERAQPTAAVAEGGTPWLY